MPTALKVGRFRFFFFNNEGSEAVHIHVESDDKYAKFWLEPVQLAKSIGYGAKELNEIRKLVLENVNFFKEKWCEHFGS
ncbi:MAG: DUF4160 domain-containing protein [Chloroflexi bacterium]|nr:DUF4160 domain-containing protein [Chloroflexota bacterium]MCL5076447.1 DUF4160 domain-containing protein [Chloroflexota bacterium]